MSQAPTKAKFFQFGEEIVGAEPSWYQHFKSPYYNAHHRKFREVVRAFVEKELKPHVDQWEEDCVTSGKEVPYREIIAKAYKAGVYSPMWPAELGGTPPEGGWNAFQDLILHDELTRCRAGGVTSIFGIPTMGLPPLLKSNNPIALQAAGEIIRGEKVVALAISEPYAGSDVANIRATAKKEGDYYILNGEKKWITLGYFADYYTVAARTGGPGHKGLSLFLVDRKWKGVRAQRMKLQGGWTAGTAMIFFEDVKVPAKYLLGEEGTGFKQIMYNFNHERWVIAVSCCRGARSLLTECMKYAAQRKTFGKRLIEHQVIRQKLADMAMRVEAGQALLEHLTYQMDQGLPEAYLGGATAMAKVFTTRTLEICVREASQLFGGASYVRGGVGMHIERAGRELRYSTIPGGSDEILADLSVRQSMALTQKALAEGLDAKL
jgi:alkylation response protein AidB-like acyl-CoA dehydrogenase